MHAQVLQIKEMTMEVFCRTVPPTSCNLQFSHLISIISRFILISKFKLPLKQARKHSSRNRKPLSTSHLSMLVLFMEQSFNSPVKSFWLSEVVNPQCIAMSSSVQISTHIHPQGSGYSIVSKFMQELKFKSIISFHFKRKV